MSDRAAVKTVVESTSNAGNLIANADFSVGEPGGLPDGWEAVCPNPALAPIFKLVCSGQGRQALLAQGNGRRECFGYVRCPVRFEADKTYCLRVRLRCEG